jgi:hypothetical protein
LRKVVGDAGKVWVYAAGGEYRAVADIGRPGYYGDLTWEPAEVYEVSDEELMAAAATVDARAW